MKRGKPNRNNKPREFRQERPHQKYEHGHGSKNHQDDFYGNYQESNQYYENERKKDFKEAVSQHNQKGYHRDSDNRPPKGHSKGHHDFPQGHGYKTQSSQYGSQSYQTGDSYQHSQDNYGRYPAYGESDGGFKKKRGPKRQQHDFEPQNSGKDRDRGNDFYNQKDYRGNRGGDSYKGYQNPDFDFNSLPVPTSKHSKSELDHSSRNRPGENHGHHNNSYFHHDRDFKPQKDFYKEYKDNHRDYQSGGFGKDGRPQKHYRPYEKDYVEENNRGVSDSFSKYDKGYGGIGLENDYTEFYEPNKAPQKNFKKKPEKSFDKEKPIEKTKEEPKTTSEALTTGQPQPSTKSTSINQSTVNSTGGIDMSQSTNVHQLNYIAVGGHNPYFPVGMNNLSSMNPMNPMTPAQAQAQAQALQAAQSRGPSNPMNPNPATPSLMAPPQALSLGMAPAFQLSPMAMALTGDPQTNSPQAQQLQQAQFMQFQAQAAQMQQMSQVQQMQQMQQMQQLGLMCQAMAASGLLPNFQALLAWTGNNYPLASHLAEIIGMSPEEEDEDSDEEDIDFADIDTEDMNQLCNMMNQMAGMPGLEDFDGFNTDNQEQDKAQLESGQNLATFEKESEDCPCCAGYIYACNGEICQQLSVCHCYANRVAN